MKVVALCPELTPTIVARSYKGSSPLFATAERVGFCLRPHLSRVL